MRILQVITKGEIGGTQHKVDGDGLSFLNRDNAIKLLSPKISVIMSVFNGGKYLKDAIKSILNQTFTDFEFIIINDGSTDESRVVIEQFADPRIKLTNKENKGIVKSLNEAVSYAIGEYIARMDADDISLPERLAKQSEFLDTHPDIGIVGSWAEAIDENGIIIKRYEFPPETDREIRSYLLRHNAFIHPTVMLKRKLISQNPYRNFKHTEDYEVWTRLLQKCKGANIPEPLIKYRVVKSSITRKHQTEIRLRGIFIRLLILFRLFLRLPI